MFICTLWQCFINYISPFLSAFTDERISFEVFLPIYQAISKSRSSDTADDFIEGLRHFDKDGSGFISSAELRHLLSTLGEFTEILASCCLVFFYKIQCTTLVLGAISKF
jgi:Ca2+-binding protein (EF-Hand superfamily)